MGRNNCGKKGLTARGDSGNIGLQCLIVLGVVYRFGAPWAVEWVVRRRWRLVWESARVDTCSVAWKREEGGCGEHGAEAHGALRRRAARVGSSPWLVEGRERSVREGRLGAVIMAAIGCQSLAPSAGGVALCQKSVRLSLR